MCEGIAVQAWPWGLFGVSFGDVPELLQAGMECEGQPYSPSAVPSSGLGERRQGTKALQGQRKCFGNLGMLGKGTSRLQLKLFFRLLSSSLIIAIRVLLCRCIDTIIVGLSY